MRRGLVIGKFYPPHRGHKHLIDTAESQVDELAVIVCAKPEHEHDIPGELRGRWLRAIHPRVHMIVIRDELGDDDLRAWAENTKRVLGYTPDVVFTSEDYGESYSRYLGCQHVLVDRGRTTVPCSGTRIRAQPLDHLEFLEPIVRAYYVKRVCLVGAESTGKTVLAESLAKHFATTWVPEYGRECSLRKVERGETEWTSCEFERIAKRQNEMEEEAAGLANRVVICDTDAFATGIWHERHMGRRSAAVESHGRQSRCDLYLLSAVEGAPFVQDGIRDGEHVRSWMHERFLEELTARQNPFLLLSGDWEQRFRAARVAIERLISPSAGS